MANIVHYKNGNYTVMLDLDNGTKIRYNDEDKLIPEFPESIDIKITNRCNGVYGKVCEFCHEKSTPDGKHGDIMMTKFIDTLHPYTELAIGGGNVLTHPDFIPFLNKCKKLKLVPSITVHQRHFMDNFDILKQLCDEKLIYGLGVSYASIHGFEFHDFVNKITQIPNAVLHVINGMITWANLMALSSRNLKILILGYKQFGRGIDYYNYHGLNIECLKTELYDWLPKIIEEEWFDVVSFDNLAIEQLDVKRLMSDDEWNKFYMGNDAQYTMYVDCVNKQFAKNSTSDERYDLMDNITDMFNMIRVEN